MQKSAIRQIRTLLAIAIVALSAALVATVFIKQKGTPDQEDIPKTVAPEIDMSLKQLHFSEMRGNDKLWELVAEQADYDKEAALARLQQVQTEIYGKQSSNNITITSKKGVYRETEQLVVMQDDVHAVSKKGLTFDTDYIEYHAGPGLIKTGHPVKVVDGRITITARGMDLLLDDETVLFKGGVNAVVKSYYAR